MLSRVRQSQEEIAVRIGVSRQSISQWRNGDIRPGEQKRELLQAVFGIDRAAWDEEPAATEEPEPLPEPLGGPAALAELLESLVTDELRSLRAKRSGSALERATAINALLGALERAAAIRRALEWRKACAVLEEALRGHPEAAVAVELALRRHDEA
jgi:transcriptional regulator with XRE-family HTH domain